MLLETKIDALDITILRGGGDAVGKWAIEHGFLLTPDAPEVLDFYSQRSPIFMAARFDATRARELGQTVRRRHADHADDPDRRAVGAAAHPRARPRTRRGRRRRRVPAHRRPARRCSPAASASSSTAASRRRTSLLADLRSDKGMGWVPDEMWFTYLQVDARGTRPRLRPRRVDGRRSFAPWAQFRARPVSDRRPPVLVLAVIGDARAAGRGRGCLLTAGDDADRGRRRRARPRTR